LLANSLPEKGGKHFERAGCFPTLIDNAGECLTVFSGRLLTEIEAGLFDKETVAVAVRVTPKVQETDESILTG
jgi:hypothetical protein